MCVCVPYACICVCVCVNCYKNDYDWSRTSVRGFLSFYCRADFSTSVGRDAAAARCLLPATRCPLPSATAAAAAVMQAASAGSKAAGFATRVA